MLNQIYVFCLLNQIYVKSNICFLSTYFCIHPFKLPYRCYDIQPELANKTSIINLFPSTFCPIFGHHQWVCTECNLSLRAIMSVFQSAVILVRCKIYINMYSFMVAIVNLLFVFIFRCYQSTPMRESTDRK